MISWENPWTSAPGFWWKLRTLPTYCIWLVTGFVSGWVQTRRVSVLLLGCPALVVAFLVMSLAVRTREGLTSETIRRYLSLSESQLNRNNVDQAEFYINRLRAMGPPNDAILTIHAGIAMQRERPDLTEQALLEMLSNSDNSRDAIAHRQLGLLQLATTKSPLSSRANEAIVHLEAAVSANSTDVEGHEILAQLYVDRGELESAARHLETVVKSKPGVAINLARIFEKLDRHSRKLEFAAIAADFYARVFDPKTVPAVTTPTDRIEGYLSWTEALTMLDRLDQAVDLLTSELDHYPSPELRKRLAATYLRMESRLSRDQWDRRVELTNLCRTYDPESAPGLVLLSNIAALGPQDLAAQAERDLQPYLDSGKAPPAAYFQMGTGAARKEDWSRAESFLRKAVELEPNAAAFWNNLALALSSKPEPDLKNAEACIDKALKLDPSPALYHETRGQIMLKLERWPEAVQELELSLLSIPADGNIHRGLSVAYEQLGDDDLADFHRTRSRPLGKN